MLKMSNKKFIESYLVQISHQLNEQHDRLQIDSLQGLGCFNFLAILYKARLGLRYTLRSYSSYIYHCMSHVLI